MRRCSDGSHDPTGVVSCGEVASSRRYRCRFMRRRSRVFCALPALAIAVGGIALAGCIAPGREVAATLAPPSCSNPWRGYVVASDHNYAGIGAYNGSTVFMCKDNPTAGVRAHLQHLRNYADPASTPHNLGNPFEPRPGYTEADFGTFRYHGQAPRWIDLNGRWAVPGDTYGQGIIRIYNEMRAGAGLAPVAEDTSIMGASELTAAQIAARVCAVGRCGTWKPEISAEAMAQIYLDEGAAVGVRGDIAFCQSILETGWFSWPNSPAGATVLTDDPVLDGYFELQHVTGRS